MSKHDELHIIQQSYVLMRFMFLTEKEVCRELYISETTLRNIFHKYFSLPPKRYIHKVHMNKARELLRTSDLPISDIAAEFHYSNVSKFSSAFKKEYNLTPFIYRQVFNKDTTF